ASVFIDYWSGPGAWARLQPWMQAIFVRWVAKVPLEFRALMEEPTPYVAYSDLCMPVLIMRGERAPRPTRMIAGLLASVLPDVRTAVVAAAGHMGPLTHAGAVSDLIVRHIEATDTAMQRACTCSGRGASDAGASAALPVGADAL